MNKLLKIRQTKDLLFRYACLVMILITFLFMAIFVSAIAFNSYKALWNYSIDIAAHKKANAAPLNLQKSFNILYDSFGLSPQDKEQVYNVLFSNRVDLEYKQALENKQEFASLTISAKAYDLLRETAKPSDSLGKFLRAAEEKGLVKKNFSFSLFSGKESRDPEFAGIKTAFYGSLIAISLALLISIPIALFSAIYLEEMASTNSLFISLVKTNIANLASVPSIVYGIIGLAIYIQYFDLPRSSALVGGLTLMLMAVPSLILTYSQALKTVPGYIKNAAVALGLSKQQVIFHHILPYCVPGIVTGSMMVLVRIMGETAPLLMIGMAAFIVDLPRSIFDPITVLPMQIYLWADSPESEFVIKSSGAIMLLLLLLTLIGSIALRVRSKFTIKW